MSLPRPPMFDNLDLLREAVVESARGRQWIADMIPDPELTDEVCNAAIRKITAADDKLRRMVLQLHRIEGDLRIPIAIAIDGYLVTLATNDAEPDQPPFLTVVEPGRGIRFPCQ